VDQVPECLSLQQFHRDERPTIDLINFIDRANVGMVKSGGSASLTAEAFERLRVTGKFIGKELQSDVPTEFEVFGFVHDAHTTAANLADNSVVGNRLAHGLGRS